MNHISFDYRDILYRYWVSLLFIISLFPVYVYVVNPLFTPGRVLTILSLVLVVFFIGFRVFRVDVVSVVRSDRLIFTLLHLYFALRLVSVFWSDDYAYALGIVILEFSQIYVCFLLGLITPRSLYGTRYVPFLLWVVVLFSIGEYIIQENFMRFFAVGESAASLAAQTISFRGEDYRAQAFFEHPLTLAHYLLILFSYFLITSRGGGGKLFIAASIVGTLVGLLTTDSRFAFLVFIAAISSGFMLYFIRIKGGRRFLIPIFLFSLPVFLIAFQYYLSQQSDGEIVSSITRLKQWEISLELLLSGSYFGLGIGDIAEKLLYYGDYMSSGEYLWRASVDSYVLIRMLESGIFAGMVLVIFIGALFFRLMLKAFRTASFRSSVALLLGAYSLSVLVISPLYTVYALFFWLLGLLVSFKQESQYE